MKKIETVEGVAAEYNGKYWGFQHGDAQYTHNDFGDFDKAEISDPKYCKKPTDLTNANSPDFEKLKKARLVNVIKTTTIEFEVFE